MGEQSLGIVGGGISGLAVAYYAVKNGQDPKNITVYEASGRFGGQIMTEQTSGMNANMGAEFIDKEHTKLIELAKELNIPLIKATDQDRATFQTPDGKKISSDEFFKKYEPIAARIRADKQEVAANPKGELAKRLNNMSAEEYLKVLGDSVPVVEHRNFWQRFVALFSSDNNRVDPDIIAMVGSAFAAEFGQPASKASALQLVHEAGSEPGAIIESGCDFRVEGGTERLIQALQAKLTEQGVEFKPGSEITSIAKNDGGSLNLDFKDGNSVQQDRVIMALPAYELAQINGLENLGFSADDKQFWSNLQYTDSMKVTIRTKHDIPNENFFSNNRFEVWTSAPGTVTFLINNDGGSATERLQEVLEGYARAQGTTASRLFGDAQEYMQKGNISISKPGKRPCYTSPGIGQALRLENMDISLARLAANNVGIAGTFLPVITKGGGVALGFMNNGVESAEVAVKNVLCEKEATMQKMIEKQQQRGRDSGATIY